MVRLISVPFDLCGPHHGSRLGALSMHLAGLVPSLAELGVEARNCDAIGVTGDMPGTREECDVAALAVFGATRELVSSAVAAGELPIVIGGDHSIAIGSISGAIAAHGDDLAVLWVDAHMDANTPDTTPSGNLHGVPLAALTRLEPVRDFAPDVSKPWLKSVHDLWPKLLGVVPSPGLRKDRLYWIGLRDVDAGEVENLKRLPGSQVATMQDLDAASLNEEIGHFSAWLQKSGAKKLWISFDVDVLDPVFAPGTGTAVRGGLTYREGHLLAERLHALLFAAGSECTLAGLDVVEVNPLRDRDNSTAQVAVEWVCSLFGKTIMHGNGRGS